MADFVSNFLEGLRERRNREERQAQFVEQVRQFEAQRAARMFEFNANRALQLQQLDLQRQQEQRQQRRQDFADALAIADLQAEGKAEEAIEGLDVPGPVVEAPSGERLRILPPEERAERQFQLDIGLARNRINSMLNMIGELGGEEARRSAEALFKDPRVIAETVFDVRLGNQPVPQSFAGAIIRDLENKVARQEITREEATQEYKKLLRQQQESGRPLIPGPGGQLTFPQTFEQQANQLVENTAASIRPLVGELTGMTAEQIVGNPEQAIVKLTEALKTRELPTAVQPFIPVVVQQLIKDIVNLNKKSSGRDRDSVFDVIRSRQQEGGVGSNLTPEQRRSLGMQ